MKEQRVVQSSVLSMQAALKQAYNVEVSEKEAVVIVTRLVSLIKLLDQMDNEQNGEVKL